MHTESVMFSQLLSFLLSTGRGGGLGILDNVPGLEHFLAKKCSCPEEGGVISQNTMQVAYINIMHCSLPVIIMFNCCQKEVLKACTCLYSQGARHSGILPPPPRAWAFWLMSQGFLAKDPPGHEHILAYQCKVCNRYLNCLLVMECYWLLCVIMANQQQWSVSL